jgi:hypothetical protein
MELITNRTQANVDRLKKLKSKGWANLTRSEKTEWYENAAKGAYNYTDLNRVENAVAELAATLGLSLTTKTNWTVWDIPTQSQMTRYLENVRTIRDACPNASNLPEVPLRMTGMTFETANRIEEILLGAWRSIEAVPRSGEIYCGEV